MSAVSQHLELLGHKTEHNALKLDKAQCSFCCYSETRPSLSPTHICKIINRCLKSLLRPAYQKHALYLTILFHFLSRHAWLRSSAFPQFHLHHSRADALRPQTHANTHKAKHKMCRENLQPLNLGSSACVRLIIPFQQNHHHQTHILFPCSLCLFVRPFQII